MKRADVIKRLRDVFTAEEEAVHHPRVRQTIEELNNYRIYGLTRDWLTFGDDVRPEHLRTLRGRINWIFGPDPEKGHSLRLQREQQRLLKVVDECLAELETT